MYKQKRTSRRRKNDRKIAESEEFTKIRENAYKKQEQYKKEFEYFVKQRRKEDEARRLRYQKPQIILGSRQNGKTTELIKMSAKTGIYILVTTKNRANHLFRQAKNMGYDMPYPVTIEEYFRDKFTGTSIRRDGLFIDDIDDVFKSIFNGINIRAVTLTNDNRYEIKNLDSKILKFKKWFNNRKRKV